MNGISFEGCKLVGADFTRCNAKFLDIRFKDCLIDTCNFTGLKLKKTSFLRCVIRETPFIDSVLESADFEESDLEGALFHHCDLQGADFSRAKNYSIDPSNNKLKGAIFSFPEAASLLTKIGINLK